MDDWDDQSEYVVHAYNSTVNASTNCTPNVLVFGEDIIMPADLVYGLPGLNPEVPCTVLFVESIKERLKEAYESVRVELQKSAKWQKVGFDTNLKHRKFCVGDRVIRFHTPLRNLKLISNWDGPFTVYRIISQSTVVIQSRAGVLYKSNVARLRIYKGRETPEVEAQCKSPKVTVVPKKRGRKAVNNVKNNNVSADERKRSRKVATKAKLPPEKAILDAGKQLTSVDLRRSE